eukprot:GDKJ01014854.1.p1 GENE.GDKJ01014854.1~~GDKJ01014854.1.p1  ORF type:complete len:646 (+),score=142.93 GDKJ01014854.1:112-2049(+)
MSSAISKKRGRPKKVERPLHTQGFGYSAASLLDRVTVTEEDTRVPVSRPTRASAARAMALSSFFELEAPRKTIHPIFRKKVNGFDEEDADIGITEAIKRREAEELVEFRERAQKRFCPCPYMGFDSTQTAAPTITLNDDRTQDSQLMSSSYQSFQISPYNTAQTVGSSLNIIPFVPVMNTFSHNETKCATAMQFDDSSLLDHPVDQTVPLSPPQILKEDPRTPGQQNPSRNSPLAPQQIEASATQVTPTNEFAHQASSDFQNKKNSECHVHEKNQGLKISEIRESGKIAEPTEVSRCSNLVSFSIPNGVSATSTSLVNKAQMLSQATPTIIGLSKNLINKNFDTSANDEAQFALVDMAESDQNLAERRRNVISRDDPEGDSAFRMNFKYFKKYNHADNESELKPACMFAVFLSSTQACSDASFSVDSQSGPGPSLAMSGSSNAVSSALSCLGVSQQQPKLLFIPGDCMFSSSANPIVDLIAHEERSLRGYFPCFETANEFALRLAGKPDLLNSSQSEPHPSRRTRALITPSSTQTGPAAKIGSNSSSISSSVSSGTGTTSRTVTTSSSTKTAVMAGFFVSEENLDRKRGGGELRRDGGQFEDHHQQKEASDSCHNNQEKNILEVVIEVVRIELEFRKLPNIFNHE